MKDFPTRISYEQVLEIVRSVAAGRRLDRERLAVSRADGRILAEDIVAPIPLPAFDNSAMDGFAIRHDDLRDRRSLPLAGELFAGQSAESPLPPGQCLRITTGAPLPAGADTVVPKENTSVGADTVRIDSVPPPGAFVRLQGTDVAVGDVVATAGSVMTAARLGLAAALGVSQVGVSARPTVAVLTTGDELVEPGMPLAPGQIYNANRDLLMALLRNEGLSPTAWPALRDEPDRIRALLADAAETFDVVITCGGVSVGEKDHLPGLIDELGEVFFWKARVRPGMPVILGRVGKCLVLGLPGNPVSTMATFLTIARSLLDALQGRTEDRPQVWAALAAPWNKQHDRHEFLRGRLACRPDGRLWVHPNPADASYQLRGAADSNALIELPEGARTFAAGEIVRVVRY
ncbi:MAG TPA: molybdopterin molybdenumtransferase MoeA [Xanthomonadaceae bacterium]|nr:molybdopterin molybdenumtransferase MoeA [Xanthomonadaceae bacterium]